MLSQEYNMPTAIKAEIQLLFNLTKGHRIEQLRARRESPNGVKVNIYHHSAGTDSYFCDRRKRYITFKQLQKQADENILPGEYSYTAIIEYKKGVHFVSSKIQPDHKLN